MAKRNDIDQLNHIVEDSSMDKYYPVYKHFLVNHLAHGQIALFCLGAPMDQIQDYTDNYIPKLEVKGGPRHLKDDSLVQNFNSVDDLLGKNSRFYDILDYFKDLLATKYEGKLEELLGGEFPKLIGGIGDSAIHPLIHIGYGYSIKSPVVVCEGLAYLHFSYFNLKRDSTTADKLGHGHKSLAEVAELLQNDVTIYNFMLEEMRNKTPESVFLSRMKVLMEHSGNDLQKFVHMLDCPRESMALINWIIDNCITLYTVAENRNDFFLLHGITSAWALSQILATIKSETVKLEVCQTFLCVLLAVYICKDMPKLNTDYLTSSQDPDLTWDQILKRVLTTTRDEHRFKLVQVALYRMGSSIEFIRAYTDNYLKKLDPKGGPLNQRDDALVQNYSSVDDLLGKNSRFYVILEYFKDLLATKYGGNRDEFLAEEFTKLIDGIGDSALHPLIHIGYGYSVKSPIIVCEGLAYLHFAYYKLQLDSYATEGIGGGDKTLLEVADLIRNDDTIFNSMLEEIKSKAVSGGFITRLRVVMDKSGNQLLKFVRMLECPKESHELMNWIIDCGITLYTMTENRNDFFVLHGTTSAWALSQILPALKSEAIKLRACQNFLCILLGVYICKDRANLNPDYLGTSEEPEITWDDLLAKIHAMPVTTEEHRYKLVQVCYEASLRNPAKSAMYIKGALTSLNYHFHVASNAVSKKLTEE